MRRADRDDPANRRVGLKEQRLGDLVARLWVGLEFFERPVAEDSPVPIPAGQRLQAGHEAAHAVADQHHLVQRRPAAVGIDRPADRSRSSRICVALNQNGCPVGYR